MNREDLQTLASEWVRLAKNDIRKKVKDFIEEVGTTPQELAYHLAISEGELDQIINGNCELTITTFAKLLIATGNALEIKPIDETPIGSYDNMPTREMLDRPLPRPRPNVFERPRPRGFEEVATHSTYRPRPSMFDRFQNPQQPTQGHFMGPNPQMPTMGHFQGDDLDDNGEEMEAPQPRDSHGRFASRRQAPTSPFASKTIDELTKIIKERLWDSEIELGTATKNDLIKFLDEKNKRMHEYKRMKELEEDPSVIDFKNRMKRTLENNPHLRDWVKNFVGNPED